MFLNRQLKDLPNDVPHQPYFHKKIIDHVIRLICMTYENLSSIALSHKITSYAQDSKEIVINKMLIKDSTYCSFSSENVGLN